MRVDPTWADRRDLASAHNPGAGATAPWPHTGAVPESIRTKGQLHGWAESWSGRSLWYEGKDEGGEALSGRMRGATAEKPQAVGLKGREILASEVRDEGGEAWEAGWRP